MGKLKYGLIGCGRIAINHIEAVQNNNTKVELVALCDIEESNIKKLLRNSSLELGQQQAINKYTDYKEMITKEELDFVAIATESGKHAKIAIDCINMGVNIIVEKPMALSIEDANKMIELANKKNVKLCVSHQNRFNKSIQRLRYAIDNQKFGKLLHGAAHVRWYRDKQYYTQADWRGTWKQDGGALMNQCLHNIDILLWMMGNEVDEVFAYTDNLVHPFIEGEDLGLALVKFKNRTYGVIEGTTNVYPHNLEETLYIFGERGTVKAGGKSVNIIEEWKFEDELEMEEQIKQKYSENPPNIYGYGHTPLYEDMIDSIINNKTPYIDGNEGKKAVELILAIYKSSKEKRSIKLPLKEFSTMDMI